MDQDFWLQFWAKVEEIYRKEDKDNIDAFLSERPILEEGLKSIANHLKESYELVEPIGRGGAGLIIRVKEKHLNLDRALKVPRPRQKELIESVKNEIGHLTSLRHDNIVRVHNLGEVHIPNYELPFPFFVMDYIANAKNLRVVVEQLLNEAKSSKDLIYIINWLSQRLAIISNAIAFLHLNQTLHFDIKPANILFNSDGKPILSDLGFAKKKTKDTTETVVGFTLFYAHPELRAVYHHLSSQNRVRKKIAPNDFKLTWDIYAFGKSILEILALIDAYFPDAVPYNYAFLYLHLAACRMLDGQNLSEDDTRRIREQQTRNGTLLATYKETFFNLPTSDLKEISYRNCQEVSDALEALISARQYRASVPELDPFYPKRVQISAGIPAPFSQRVKAIIEHPCFVRLNSVSQLGLINTIYPGATHTRFEHSIGAYRNACAYVQSLLNDPFNPLFRQLVSDEDICCILVASLLHDLGQYPYAHELEEVDDGLRHEKFTLDWLNNPSFDKDNHTIREIIENRDWGWGVSIGKLKMILSAAETSMELFDKKDLKLAMLSSIIDGPIDVDKLDYLIRDSQNAFLPYGDLIDADRLIRNLTVVITEENGKTILTLGTYEKGQSAAETITLSRYLMYQALYWHHTARSIRVMLKAAVRGAIGKRRKGRKAKISFFEAFRDFLGIAGIPENISNTDFLNFISDWTDAVGKELIEMIKRRIYFKRILTIHSYYEEEGRPQFLEMFRSVYDKAGFSKRLQERIKTHLASYLSQVEGPLVSSLAPDKTDAVMNILDGLGRILCDCPDPPYGSREKLRFIPEPQRLLRNYLSRANVGERVSEVWQQVYFKLIGIASKGRIYCHPSIRDTLMSALGPEGILSEVKLTVDEFS